MHTAEDINNILRKFIAFASTEFPVRYYYLFGSYAKGNPGEYSDIDVAVVSDKFIGDRFEDRENLAK